MVECGGLENRFSGNRNGGSNPSPSARRIFSVSTFQIILAAFAAGIFFYAWRKGQLLRLANYVSGTKVELRKCTWPTRDELRGSTVVVMVAIAMIGLYTVVVDVVVSFFVKALVN